MRLIDADALMENYGLKDATKYGNKDAEQQEHSYSTLMLYEIADIIEDAPTVEAKPVIHGEWKYDWLGEYICSNCYERVTVKEVMGEPAWDWCPACGADMRGGKNE